MMLGYPEVDKSTRKSEIILYKAEDGKMSLQVRIENETAWLNQKMIAELFQVFVLTINEHIKNIMDEGEFKNKATIRKFLIVQIEGDRRVSRDVDFFNPDRILAIGYCVRSDRGTQFRQWATQKLNHQKMAEFCEKYRCIMEELVETTVGLKNRKYNSKLNLTVIC